MKALFIILIFFSFKVYALQDYRSVDSLVNKYPQKFNSIEELADKISKDFKTELNKTRAAYYWIANNITYDYKLERKGSKPHKIKSSSKSDYEAKLYKLKRKYAEKVLRRKTAICEGYAQLLTEVLKDLDIISVVVSGYAKRFPNEIGKKRSSANHAWNAVRIDKKWCLIDATWSTGNSLYNAKFFNFYDSYFLIDPSKLILSHFPEDNQWQLLKDPISKINYFNLPIYYPAYHTSGLKLENNFNGKIVTQTDSIISIDFADIDENKTYYYSFDEGKSDKLEFSFENNSYTVLIPYKYRRKKNLTISDGQLALIKFKIVLKTK